MKLRTRTINGKSLNIPVSKPLKAVASTDCTMTFEYKTESYGKQHLITLGEGELVELMKDIDKWMCGKEVKNEL